MLIIDAPVCRPSDVEPLVQAGAGCLYGGLTDSEDDLDVATRNGRQSPAASFRHIEEMAAAVQIAHELGVPFVFTANARQYEPGTFERQKRQVMLAKEIGVDRVVVGGLPVLLFAQEVFGPHNIVASVFLGTMNSEACAFLRELGVRTIVLPRPLTPAETVALARRNPDLLFEVIVMNDRCVNIDAYCGYSHFEIEGVEPGHTFCRCSKGDSFACTVLDACGACEIAEYKRAENIRYLKVAGRGLPVSTLVKDVAFINAVVHLSQADDLEVMTLYEEHHGYPCGRKCYR